MYAKGSNGKLACPCCRCFTLSEIGGYEICPVCFWEDDGTDGDHPFAPNAVELSEARDNYLAIGVSEPRFSGFVRAPAPEELPV